MLLWDGSRHDWRESRGPTARGPGAPLQLLLRHLSHLNLPGQDRRAEIGRGPQRSPAPCAGRIFDGLGRPAYSLSISRTARPAMSRDDVGAAGPEAAAADGARGSRAHGGAHGAQPAADCRRRALRRQPPGRHRLCHVPGAAQAAVDGCHQGALRLPLPAAGHGQPAGLLADQPRGRVGDLGRRPPSERPEDKLRPRRAAVVALHLVHLWPRHTHLEHALYVSHPSRRLTAAGNGPRQSLQGRGAGAAGHHRDRLDEQLVHHELAPAAPKGAGAL